MGSYIWSHLTNLMETSDRHKQHIRAILEDETFKKEFDLDQRKFSRNYEGSMFVEKLNTGAKAEGDLIWSSKSFIPRSGMVNLTVELFGQSVNLLELGGRAEGIEYFLESFFGPNGYFHGEEAQEESKDMALRTIRQDKIKRIDGRVSVYCCSEIFRKKIVTACLTLHITVNDIYTRLLFNDMYERLNI